MTREIIDVNHTDMALAWKNYIQSNEVNSNIVNKTVVNSWNRCRNLNVDPYINNTSCILGRELEERIKNRENLIKIARPFMQNLYNFVKGSGFQVVLCDEQGILLEVLGDQEILKLTKQVLLCPGGDWSEKSKGTNAIGTALMEQKPVQIYAHEHFCQANHFLTCSASPIYDPDGQLIGVLDVSGDYRKANPHTLGMVVAAVYAIESQLRLHKASSKLYMAYKYSNSIIESMSEGLLTIDNLGNITHLNSLAAKILAINISNYEGKSLENLLGNKTPILDVLKTGKGYCDREVILDNGKGRRHFTSTVSPLFDDYGDIIGATAIVREMKSVQRLVSRLTGTQARFTFGDIIGESSAMSEAINMAKLAANNISTILLNGESGTGKELFAQAIHNAGSRVNNPFIAINCGALPRDLIESELFGYEEGAFTGAQKGGRPGKFELANGGTIFLDEIGDMPLETQVKLLRVLQEKHITRVGGHKIIPVDIRIIAATHRNLREEVAKGNFRADLFYRLNVINILIPPLRERDNDLVVLTKYLVNKIANRLNIEIDKIPQEFIQYIQGYSWPGNVRELENALERVINLTIDGVLKINALPEQIKQNQKSTTIEKNNTLTATDITPLWMTEKKAIENALNIHEGNITRVSEVLGIGRNTLYRKIKEYNL